jgi:hypothetical protein
MAAVSSAAPSFGLTGHRDMRVGPARLGGERTSATLLAIKAVADGHTDWLAFALRAKLAAPARCCSCTHLNSLLMGRKPPLLAQCGHSDYGAKRTLAEGPLLTQSGHCPRVPPLGPECPLGVTPIWKTSHALGPVNFWNKAATGFQKKDAVMLCSYRPLYRDRMVLLVLPFSDS